MVDCVIFDCDGTLVDSELLGCLGLEIMLGELGVRMSAAELVEEFKGVHTDLVVEILAARYDLSLPADFISSYRSLCRSLFDDRLQPVAGVPEMLRQIRQPRCVGSNGPPDQIRRSLQTTGIDSFFGENIFSAYDIGVWKPEPQLFLHAAESMGVAPDKCVVIEDTMLGVSAAVAAGIPAFLYDPNNDFADGLGYSRFASMDALPKILAAME